jgi:hypothetical protein
MTTGNHADKKKIGKGGGFTNLLVQGKVGLYSQIEVHEMSKLKRINSTKCKLHGMKYAHQ